MCYCVDKDLWCDETAPKVLDQTSEAVPLEHR